MKKILVLSIFVIGIIATILHQYYNQDTKNSIISDSPTQIELTIFKDWNNLHLEAGARYGVEPVEDRCEARKHIDRLTHITSNRFYKIDNLTHSIPYLTTGADSLLKQIGKNCQDSLISKGYANHRIIVTSVLRTLNDVVRLRQSGNPNAAKNSAHSYATTFDITYIRFDKIDSSNNRKNPSQKEMFMTLAQVLKDLKMQRKCYVLYEIRQRCFHITTRIG